MEGKKQVQKSNEAKGVDVKKKQRPKAPNKNDVNAKNEVVIEDMKAQIKSLEVTIEALKNENALLSKDCDTLKQRLSIVRHENDVKDREIKQLELALQMYEARIRNYNAIPWIKRIFIKLPVK